MRMECTCDKGSHTAPLETVEISDGAIYKLPKILEKYKSIYLVADEITYEICGKKCGQLLKDVGISVRQHVLKKPVLPNERALGEVMLHVCDTDADYDITKFAPLPELVLAVGSGVINDLCRVVSFRLGIPYAVVATAPSMDGYASAGSPIVFNKSKQTVKGTTARHIIADLDINAAAPYEMLLAGIGDMLGKYTGIADWELARDIDDEYFCPKIADMVIEASDKCIENGKRLKDRNHETIKNIIEGLIVTGIGMAYTGVSRPASGSEHMVGHIWELEALLEDKEPNLHGLEVAEGTLAVCAVYRFMQNHCSDMRAKKIIDKYIPVFDRVENVCRELEIPCLVTQREKIKTAVIKARHFRKRFTILTYADAEGKLEAAAQYAADYVAEFFEKI